MSEIITTPKLFTAEVTHEQTVTHKGAVVQEGAVSMASTLAVTGLATLAKLSYATQDIVATDDGTTTGTIADTGLLTFCSVDCDGDANHIVILPTPTPGAIVILGVGADGCELRSSAPATVAINGGTGATAESALPADTLAILVCTSATTWQGIDLTATTLAAIEAAA